MWVINSFCFNGCDLDEQGSTGPMGLKGEVCPAACIHHCVSATYCFVYSSHWDGISARKGQQGNQGKEVKGVRWEALDNLVYQAHQDLEDWWETQVCLVHLDRQGDLYGNQNLYGGLCLSDKLFIQSEKCKLRHSSSFYRLWKRQTITYVKSAERFFTVSLILSDLAAFLCVLSYSWNRFNHSRGAAFVVAWQSAEQL